jgi:hypothetical protein
MRELAFDLDILLVALFAQALIALGPVLGFQGYRIKSEVVTCRLIAGIRIRHCRHSHHFVSRRHLSGG